MAAAAVGAALLAAVPNAATAAHEADSYGLVDPTTGVWHLYDAGSEVGRFYFGNPGDRPFEVVDMSSLMVDPNSGRVGG